MLKEDILGNFNFQNLGDFDICEFFEFCEIVLVVDFPGGLEHRGSVCAKILSNPGPYFHDFYLYLYLSVFHDKYQSYKYEKHSRELWYVRVCRDFERL